jgi:hypothetical protein
MDVADLGTAERALWHAFPRGETVDLSRATNRTVRAGVLRALLLGAQPAEPGHSAALRLTGAHVTEALDLSHATLTCSVTLTGCRFDQPVELYGARTRELDLAGCELPGLSASHAAIDGTMRLSRCRCTGPLRLVGTRISGTLLLHGAHLGTDPSAAGGPGGSPAGGRTALSATRLTVGHDVVGRDGLVCDGEVRLNNAEVGGSIGFEGARLRNPGGTALSAVYLTVGAVASLCEDFAASGTVNLAFAKIGSRLCFEHARLSKVDGVALSCRHVQTDDLVLLTAEPIVGEVDLRHARVGVLRDEPRTWPRVLRLDGFTYQALGDRDRPRERVGWLRRDPHGYLPGTYEQLASVYRRLGHEGAARTVLLRKQRHRRAGQRPLAKAWGYVQDVTVGYGYRPGRAAVWLAALLALGTWVFASQPPVPDPNVAPPPFNPFVYALDLLLPIVDFHQESGYTPRGATAWMAYLLVAAGWVLATTLAAGATRALRRD